jgi:hypothetical protein
MASEVEVELYQRALNVVRSIPWSEYLCRRFRLSFPPSVKDEEAGSAV